MNTRNLIIVLIVFVGIFLITIMLKTNNQERATITKSIFNPYVFMDGADVIHSNANCIGIAKPTKDFKVLPFMADSVTKDNLSKICSRCITEDQFTYLIERADSNSIK